MKLEPEAQRIVLHISVEPAEGVERSDLSGFSRPRLAEKQREKWLEIEVSRVQQSYFPRRRAI